MPSAEANYSVTVKTPKGNLVTVRGDSADEWKANLEAAGKSGALATIAEIERGLSAAQASRPAAVPPTATPSVAPPAAAPSNPASPARSAVVLNDDDQQLPAGMGEPACETCGGPTRFDKEGISQKSGKPYRRYLCKTNQLHASTFV